MSSVFYKTKPIVGLDITKTSVKIMAIDKNKMLVHGYGSINLDPEKNDIDSEENVPYLAEKIRELLNNHIVGRIDSNRIALGVSTSRTFSRTFSLAPKIGRASCRERV